MVQKGGFLIVLMVLALTARSQYFQTGQDPASIHWRQINTENFQLVYPEEFETQAQKMAAVLERVYNYGGKTLNHQPRKISVILHTQTVQSNGLLAWAPRRVEMYTTPSQSLYPQDWLEQLAIHEFRHVVQVDKISQSLPQIITLLLAQQGAALVTGAYLPFWFLEGDAVAAETALSKTGRGRFPSFLMETQAQLVQNGIYNFDKAYLGSYKDFVPNHYKMGYYLVGGARNYYGSGIWNTAVERVGEKPFSLTPFRSAIKSVAAMNQRQLYRMVFDSLRQEWIKKDQTGFVSPCQVLSHPAKTVTNYNYNFFEGKDTIITLKDAFNSVSHFTKIDANGNENKVLTTGAVFEESVGKTGHWLTWSERIPDPRWEHSGRSLIRFLNLKTGEIRNLKPEYKAFSPAISPDLKKLALVEADFGNNYYLSVYDIESGKLITRFQDKNNRYMFTPKWFNNTELAVIFLNEKGKSMVLLNPDTGKKELLIDESMGELKHLVVKEDEVYFISSYAGKNDLYVINTANKNISRVFSSRFGVEYPAVSETGDEIVLSDYTANGFRLIKAKDSESAREPLSSVKKGSYPLADKLATQEKGVVNFTKVDTAHYESKKYSKAGHLLHFHSWAPVYFDVDNYGLQPGISIFSQNKLGTAETSLGYKWDRNEKAGKLYAKFIYKGWYPLFSFEITQGKRKSEYTQITHYTNQQNEIVRTDTSHVKFNWSETTIDLGAWIPFDFSQGRYYRLLQPEIKYELSARHNAVKEPDGFILGAINSANIRLYYHQIRRKAYQDLVPDFGFATDFSYRFSPWSAINLGSLTSFQLINYLPGFMKNHGWVIYNGIQKRNSQSGYSFSDAVRYPRGWGKYLNDFMYSFSAEYKFPLFYPDFSFNGVWYLKRIKATLYADYAYQEGNLYNHGQFTDTYTRPLSSFGTDIIGDMHFLRFYAPVEMGARIGYLPELSSMHYGFLLSVNFTSF